jgi:iron complex outermembrane receptor protein
MTIMLRCVGVFALATFAAVGQTGLADASLEQLLNVEVTSVSKKEQKLSRTAAAVFVIGHEDIRRSGAQNLPDVLRMAPGVEVIFRRTIL